jgi:hypothetical protein
VLRTILDRKRIYRTPTARDMWENRARANLSQEIEFLAQTPLKGLPGTDLPTDLPSGPPQQAPYDLPPPPGVRHGGAAGAARRS